MIVLNVEDYCHSCLDFSPDILPPTRLYTNTDTNACEYTNTVIRCEHRKRCAAIKRYLEQQTKTKEDV